MLRNLKRENSAGFASMVEVVVTAIIFVLATAGILSTISLLRPHSQESSQRVEAAYIGKGIIDQLRKDVYATPGSFFGSNLALGTHAWPTVDGYNIIYTVTEPTPNLRQLTMNITWP